MGRECCVYVQQFLTGVGVTHDDRVDGAADAFRVAKAIVAFVIASLGAEDVLVAVMRVEAGECGLESVRERVVGGADAEETCVATGWRQVAWCDRLPSVPGRSAGDPRWA
jgi:hypothetical protein